MFKKTDTAPELSLFESPSHLLSKRGSKKYEDPHGWHNLFFNFVTCKIDESVFSPLFKSGNMGAPNASVRVLVGMSILKEGFGCSDEDLFDKCEFDLLTRKALGLSMLDDALPSLDTYYLFRRRICEYEETQGVNLMEKSFCQVTGEQIKQFKISGKAIRMDSKLIGSNIAWYSRYEIIHNTFRCAMENICLMQRLNPSLRKRMEAFLSEDAQKTVYRSDSTTLAERIIDLGQVIYQVLVRIKADDTLLLYRVFHEQYMVEQGKITARDKKTISARSVQNPHDPDADYRKKGDQKIKGYSTNITETVDEQGKPNLITDVQVKPANASDNGYVQEAIQSTEKVTGATVERLYADGAYQSEDNRTYASLDKIELMITGIQGKPSRFELEMDNDGLRVTDKKTGEIIPAKKLTDKWRIEIKGKCKYRYFSQSQIQNAEFRRRLSDIPIEEQNKRNNVEATIFQYCFHTRNNKTRYRELLKHKLYSYARCLWINCRRLLIFLITTSQRTLEDMLNVVCWAMERYLQKEKGKFHDRMIFLKGILIEVNLSLEPRLLNLYTF